jgi:predicted O-methyltransferase YrrM
MQARAEVANTLEELERQRQHQLASFPRRGRGLTDPHDRDRLMLAVGPDTGRFLNTLLGAIQARRALEIGGSMGYSTIWQAEALERTGGSLITLEAVPSKVEILKRRIAQAGLEQTVQVLAGDARTILPTLPGPFDLVLIDAWKDDYPTYFDLVFPKLRVGGLIVADNITRPSPPSQGILEYLRKVRSHPGAQTQLIPIGSGLELTIRLA